jgi:hypothetical protein
MSSYIKKIPAPRQSEEVKRMKTSLWLLFVLVAASCSFWAGYSTSSHTGTEPGYFEAVEAAGYGGGGELEKVEGISDDMQEYYKDLTETE